MSNLSAAPNDHDKFAVLIKGIKFAMLTTTNSEFGPENGQLRSRPMTLQDTEFDGDLWFLAGKDGSAVADIQAQPRVNLAFSDVKNNSYVSASGRAEVVEDRNKAEELWSLVYAAWFPEGVDDPNLCLIKVSVETVDYWDSPHSSVAYALGFATAILSGKKVEDLGNRGHFHA